MNCQLRKGVFCVVLEPKKMQPIAIVLKMLLEGDTGVVRIKQIAHNHVGWPCIDKDIENLDKTCTSSVYSSHQDHRAPIAARLHP